VVGPKFGQGGVERPTEVGRFDRIRRWWDRRFRSASAFERPAPPQSVDGRVVRDAEKPARKAAAGVERAEPPICLEECLLCEIFGQRRIVDHPREQAQHRTLVAADDLPEGRLGAGSGVGNEAGVGLGLKIERYGVASVRLTTFAAPQFRTPSAERSVWLALARC